MARRIAIPSKAAQLKLVGPRDALVIPRVQRLTMTADRPSTDIDELGSETTRWYCRRHASYHSHIPSDGC